jgi:hypothetical protein
MLKSATSGIANGCLALGMLIESGRVVASSENL